MFGSLNFIKLLIDTNKAATGLENITSSIVLPIIFVDYVKISAGIKIDSSIDLHTICNFH